MFYYLVNEYHWSPQIILECFEDENIKALLNAIVNIRIKSDKEQMQKAKRKSI